MRSGSAVEGVARLARWIGCAPHSMFQHADDIDVIAECTDELLTQ
jgi:hypothetical protein